MKKNLIYNIFPSFKIKKIKSPSFFKISLYSNFREKNDYTQLGFVRHESGAQVVNLVVLCDVVWREML
jgi:hypothetical protein